MVVFNYIANRLVASAIALQTLNNACAVEFADEGR